MIVADSDVLIDALAGREPYESRVREEIARGSLATTTVNAFELLSGARSPATREKIQTLIGAMIILPFDEQAAAVATGVRRELEASGKAIGMADYLIAAICLARSAPLLTRNVAHFARVPGLPVLELEGG